jgi:hypothetical protein
LDQQGLALLRAAILARIRFVGPPVFCINHPAGKPANYSPNGEPHNELYQFHLFSLFFCLAANLLPLDFKNIVCHRFFSTK